MFYTLLSFRIGDHGKAFQTVDKLLPLVEKCKFYPLEQECHVRRKYLLYCMEQERIARLLEQTDKDNVKQQEEYSADCEMEEDEEEENTLFNKSRREGIASKLPVRVAAQSPYIPITDTYFNTFSFRDSVTVDFKRVDLSRLFSLHGCYNGLQMNGLRRNAAQMKRKDTERESENSPQNKLPCFVSEEHEVTK